MPNDLMKPISLSVVLPSIKNSEITSKRLFGRLVRNTKLGFKFLRNGYGSRHFINNRRYRRESHVNIRLNLYFHTKRSKIRGDFS